MDKGIAAVRPEIELFLGGIPEKRLEIKGATCKLGLFVYIVCIGGAEFPGCMRLMPGPMQRAWVNSVRTGR